MDEFEGRTLAHYIKSGALEAIGDKWKEKFKDDLPDNFDITSMPLWGTSPFESNRGNYGFDFDRTEGSQFRTDI